MSLCGAPTPADETVLGTRTCIRPTGHPWVHRDSYGHTWKQDGQPFSQRRCKAISPIDEDSIGHPCALQLDHEEVCHKTAGGFLWPRAVETVGPQCSSTTMGVQCRQAQGHTGVHTALDGAAHWGGPPGTSVLPSPTASQVTTDLDDVIAQLETARSVLERLRRLMAAPETPPTPRR